MPVVLSVGNLSRNVSDAHLREIFGNYGLVKKVAIVTDAAANNLSKGFGTVEFSARRLGLDAIEHLDGANVDGMHIRVSLARPPPP